MSCDVVCILLFIEIFKKNKTSFSPPSLFSQASGPFFPLSPSHIVTALLYSSMFLCVQLKDLRFT